MYTTSSVISNIHIKVIIGEHFPPTRMVIITVIKIMMIIIGADGMWRN